MNRSSLNCLKYVWRTDIHPVKNGLKGIKSANVTLIANENFPVHGVVYVVNKESSQAKKKEANPQNMTTL